jgi:hypothetical protein
MIDKRHLFLRRFRVLSGSRMLLLKVNARFLLVIIVRLIPKVGLLPFMWPGFAKIPEFSWQGSHSLAQGATGTLPII